MTKWKGKVVSIALVLGSVIAPLMLAGAMMLSAPQQSLALNECGPEAAGPDAITCNAGNYAGVGGWPNFDSGITYENSDGLTLTLDDPGITVSNPGVRIFSADGASDAISIDARNFNTITTTSNYLAAGGLEVRILGDTSTAPATVTMHEGTIVTSGRQGEGIRILHYGTGPATATLHGGEITVTGPYAMGVLARSVNPSSTAPTTALMTGGRIYKSGDYNGCLVAWTDISGETVARITGGELVTTGDYAYGMLGGGGYAGSGDVFALMEGGSITTSGLNSHGVWAFSSTQGGGAYATVSGGQIVTTGTQSHGIYAWEYGGSGISSVTLAGGRVTVSGENADGILANGGQNGMFNVDVTGGILTSGTGRGAGVHTLAANGGTVDILAGATIDGSASGIAVRDGDGDYDGIDETGGNVVVTTAGTVTGDAILGLGDDTFNLTGGTYTGEVYGDDVDASDRDGNDAFNWSGGVFGSSYYGQNGSDTALISASTYDGTYHVLDGGDDYSIADGWIDELTLRGTSIAPGGDDIVVTGANIINWENVVLDGGTLTFSDNALEVGADTGTGLFIRGGGVVDGASTFALTGNMIVESDGTFQGFGGGSGTYGVSGTLNNAGTLTMQDNATGDVLTVGGDYSGTGTLQVDSDVDAMTSDMLVIEGEVTGGRTSVGVNNLGTTGSDTGSGPGAGIAVVDVSATGGTAEGDFVLAGGPFAAGAFIYDLNLETDSIWYLQSSLLPQVPTYEAYPQTLLGLQTMPTMQQRIGNRWNWMSCDGTVDRTAQIEAPAFWSRAVTEYTSIEPERSTTGTSYEQQLYRFEAGADLLLGESDGGSKAIAGLRGHYVTSDTDVESLSGDGEIETTGYGLGVSLTWLDASGFYADAQGTATWYDSDLSSDESGSLVKDNEGLGYALSLETGVKVPVSANWTVTPQAQLTYSSVDFDGFTGPDGEEVSVDEAESLKLRLGVAVDRDCIWTDREGVQRSHLYAIANVHKEFEGKSTVEVSSTPLVMEPESWSGELGLGYTRDFNDESWSLYGEAAVATGLDDPGESYRFGATLGLRVNI